MNASTPQSLADIADAIAAGAHLDADTVKRVRQILYGEERLYARMLDAETVDRAEADLLWRIQRSHKRAHCDPSWHELFAEAMTSHVLRDETSPGTLDDTEADYLLSHIHADGGVEESELGVLVSVISAVRHAPSHFQSYVLAAVADAVLSDGAIDDGDVRLIRRVVHSEGSGGGQHVDERERQFLDHLAARASGLRCSPLWRALLLEAGLTAQAG